MNFEQPTTLLSFISLLFFPFLVSPQSCKNKCGGLPIRYPFGSGGGCGDPRFQNYVTCDQEKLVLTTHTGSYPVETIDYNNQILYLTDPTMSTCSSTQPSKGFGLDWNAPFAFSDDDVFALLDCSTSSDLYKSKNNSNNGTSLCDSSGVPICSLLFSCRPLSSLNFPISTCCIYSPVDLGPSFDMDLKKLQCTTYAGIYSFSGDESDPRVWNYGVALKYRFSVDDTYPTACGICENSNGVCGFTIDAYDSFVCNCPNRVNTTTDCYFASTFWNHGFKLLPGRIGIWLISFGLILIFVVL